MPLVSLVENMAYFDDPSGGRHHPFGSSQLAAVRADAELVEAAAFRLPIDATLTDACDAGVPLVVGTPDAAAAAVFDAAAARLVPDLLRLQHGGGGGGADAAAAAGGSGSSVRYDPLRGLVLRVLRGADEGREYVLDRAALGALPGAPAAAAAKPRGPPLIESVEPAADAAGEAAVRVVWAEAVGGGETVVSHAEVRERAGEE